MKKTVLLLLSALFLSTPLYGVTRMVVPSEDIEWEGALRNILRDACNDEGDDLILFHHTYLPEIRVVLVDPLVIPPDCIGQVTIHGSDEVETILDGSLLEGGGGTPGDSCILHVYSDGHTLENLTFVGNDEGAGICLFGRDNTVQGNFFGKQRDGTENPNRYGIVISDVFASQYPEMTGNNNRVIGNQIVANLSTGLHLAGDSLTITNNTIAGNGGHGIWIQSSDSTLASNTILANGGCPEEDLLDSQTVTCRDDGVGGYGILIAAGSSNIVVGGMNYETDHNTIQYNQAGGIVIVGNQTSERHRITHNIISKNYGSGLGVDLRGDGITENDPQDLDEGPNHLMNFIDHLQAFPLVPSPEGLPRYWSWGVARFGNQVEVYVVSPEDTDREISHGGGDEFVADSAVEGRTFAVPPNEKLQPAENSWATALSFDVDGNTSEYAANIPVGADEDLDGILNSRESGDGTEESGGSSPLLTDSDDDGLPDSLEDKNRNGLWEPELGETATFHRDSDEDGIEDWYETHGDGIYDLGIDTNPLNADSDGDGLSDSEEDKNGNGVWDAHLKETNPLSPDSDGDGFLDPTDTCPSVPNPGQEPWYC